MKKYQPRVHDISALQNHSCDGSGVGISDCFARSSFSLEGQQLLPRSLCDWTTELERLYRVRCTKVGKRLWLWRDHKLQNALTPLRLFRSVKSMSTSQQHLIKIGFLIHFLEKFRGKTHTKNIADFLQFYFTEFTIQLYCLSRQICLLAHHLGKTLKYNSIKHGAENRSNKKSNI